MSRNTSPLKGITQPEISEMAQKAHNGDVKAFELLYKHYKYFLEFHAKRYFIPRERNNDEIVQEANIAFFRAIQSYEYDSGVPFEPFLRLVLTRKLQEIVKIKNREKHKSLNSACSMNVPIERMYDTNDAPESFYADPNDLNDPSEAVLSKVRYKLVIDTITADLTPFEKDVFLCYFVNEMTMKEIMKALNKHYKAIDNALQRIKKKAGRHKEELCTA